MSSTFPGCVTFLSCAPEKISFKTWWDRHSSRSVSLFELVIYLHSPNGDHETKLGNNLLGQDCSKVGSTIEIGSTVIQLYDYQILVSSARLFKVDRGKAFEVETIERVQSRPDSPAAQRQLATVPAPGRRLQATSYGSWFVCLFRGNECLAGLADHDVAVVDEELHRHWSEPQIPGAGRPVACA